MKIRPFMMTIVMVSMGVACPVHAAIIAAYVQAGVGSAAPGDQGPGVAAEPLAGVGVPASISAEQLSADQWGAASFNPNEYVEFSFTSTTPYDLGLLGINYDRNSMGPRFIRGTISIDGGASFSDIFSNTVSTGDKSIIVSLNSFDAVKTAIFRVHAWGATNTVSGALRIKATGSTDGPFDGRHGLVLTGTAVPEPASLALAGIGMLFLSGRRRARA